MIGYFSDTGEMGQFRPDWTILKACFLGNCCQVGKFTSPKKHGHGSHHGEGTGRGERKRKREKGAQREEERKREQPRCLGYIGRCPRRRIDQTLG